VSPAARTVRAFKGDAMTVAMSNVILVPGAIVLGALVLAILVFKAMWRVAEPNEALIISGLREKGIAKDSSGDEMGFRIVTGKGTLVLPGVQAVRRLSLDLHIDELALKRLKKRKLMLKDQITRLESQLIPDLNA